MAEEERVSGSIASLEGGAEDRDAVARRLRDVVSELEKLIDEYPAGRVDSDDDHALMDLVLLCGNPRVLGDRVRGDLGFVEARPYFQPEHVREVRRSIHKAFAAARERQPALPDLDALGAGWGDMALLMSAATHEGRRETLSHLRDRIAELSSAPEVPIRALRNPGKILGELAEKGEAARVTNHGKIVGWLMPATEAEQQLDDLLKQGRLRRGTPAPIEPIDVDGLERPLSEALTEDRDRERS
ncbi:hypothetical protein [Streptomyces asiaticus]